MTEQELWRSIDAHDSYEVSSLGRVRRGGRILAHSVDAKGYCRVSFWTTNGARKVSVHTLVARAFLGPKPHGQVTRHGDGNPSNNRASNLGYGTAAQNEHDKRQHGTTVRGVKHWSNKLTEAQVAEIRRRYIPRDPEHGGAALGREFGIATKTACDIAQRRRWIHIT